MVAGDLGSGGSDAVAVGAAEAVGESLALDPVAGKSGAVFCCGAGSLEHDVIGAIPKRESSANDATTRLRPAILNVRVTARSPVNTSCVAPKIAILLRTSMV